MPILLKIKLDETLTIVHRQLQMTAKFGWRFNRFPPSAKYVILGLAIVALHFCTPAFWLLCVFDLRV